MSLNHITIQGRLTKTPELRYTQSDKAVLSFSLAVDRDYAGTDGQKATDFIDCVAWEKSAEFIQKYFDKGQMILVSGRLQIRLWKDKDGNNRRSAEVQVDHAYFCGPKAEKPAESGFTEIPDEGELPF